MQRMMFKRYWMRLMMSLWTIFLKMMMNLMMKVLHCKKYMMQFIIKTICDSQSSFGAAGGKPPYGREEKIPRGRKAAVPRKVEKMRAGGKAKK